MELLEEDENKEGEEEGVVGTELDYLIGCSNRQHRDVIRLIAAAAVVEFVVVVVGGGLIPGGSPFVMLDHQDTVS